MPRDWTPTHELLNDSPGRLLAAEWLLTNGTGAYAMGTAAGCPTRRYHGLLIAATQPPLGRVVALNQVFDQLTFEPTDEGGAAPPPLELGACLFPGDDGHTLVDAPQGRQSLVKFERGLTCRWTYQRHDLTVTRELILHDKAQAITLHWTVEGLNSLASQATLHVTPMLSLRDFHELLRQGEVGAEGFAVTTGSRGRRVTVRRNDVVVTMAASAGQFVAAENPPQAWWYNLAYPGDTARGQSDREDLHAPGSFQIPLKPRQDRATASLTVTLGEKPASPQSDTRTRQKALQKNLAWLPGSAAEQRQWAIAADDFVVQRTVGDKKLATILAGYPWFGDWGRDTFIALPGLLLTPNRLNEARDVLRAFAGSIKDGLVPNRFDDYGQAPAYNTVDASLWFIHAGLEWAHWSCKTLPPWLRKAMCDILDAYAAGTQATDHAGQPAEIRMDADGLITAGHAGTQLTWMDAACGGVVFTPRYGKCVEINALWHHCLTGVAQWLDDADPLRASWYLGIAVKAKKSFAKVFWSDEAGRLLDHVTPQGEADPSLRPNMIFACSLARSPLALPRQRMVVAQVREHLLTPLGLRTLPREDPAYHPYYGGAQFQRDEAYHQGTVWPWLIGAYAEAVYRTHAPRRSAKAEALAALAPLRAYLQGDGLGQLPELFDAEPALGAQQPKGCIAQAWSVAEVLRVAALLESA